MEVLGLTNLAFVASANKPANVLVQMRPPEAEKKVTSSREDAFMT
jgi:hypothetical protein